MKTKSGYVALIGRTNVGKSTFLNAMLDMKISIVSDKPQTTRRQILGIKTTKRGQIVFFDSPGIHVPHFELNKKMMKHVHSSYNDADIILYFKSVDEKRKDEFITSLLENASKKTFLIINKIDKYNKGRALEAINFFKDEYKWDEIIPISALKRLNLENLEKLIYDYLPEMPNLYPEDEYTIQSEKYYISEIIREKLLNQTRDELPFSTSVYVEEMEKKDRIVLIRAIILVDRVSQRKIIIGKRGNLIKEIGTTARLDLQEYFDKKVFLELFVKVSPNWRNSPHLIKDMLNEMD